MLQIYRMGLCLITLFVLYGTDRIRVSKFLNIAKYFKTLCCGCGAVKVFFSIYLKPVLYLQISNYRYCEKVLVQRSIIVFFMKKRNLFEACIFGAIRNQTHRMHYYHKWRSLTRANKVKRSNAWRKNNFQNNIFVLIFQRLWNSRRMYKDLSNILRLI